MNHVLARWNDLSVDEAAEEILPCCGSRTWAHRMAARKPFVDERALEAVSDEIWSTLEPSDWLEAFASHPRIGEAASPLGRSAKTRAWSGEEQKNVGTAGEDLKLALREGNRAYEQRFHRVFIVCATGKSPQEILKILVRRLRNDDSTEVLEAAEQQRQITQLRLKKWLKG